MYKKESDEQKIIAFTGWSQVDIFVGMHPGESFHLKSIALRCLLKNNWFQADCWKQQFSSIRCGCFFSTCEFSGRVEGKQPSLKKGVFPIAEQGIEQIFFFPLKFEIFSEKDHLLKVALNPLPYPSSHISHNHGSVKYWSCISNCRCLSTTAIFH